MWYAFFEFARLDHLFLNRQSSKPEYSGWDR